MRSDPAGEGLDEAALVSRLLWALAAVTCLLALLSAAIAGVRFSHVSDFAIKFGGYLALMGAVRVYARFRGLGDERFRLCVDVAATFGVIALAHLVIQYAAATSPAPDATALVQRADHALGFNWYDYAHFVSGIAPLWRTLQFCYGNWMAEMVAAMALLAYLRRYEAIGEFAIAFSLTCLSIIAVFACIDVHSVEAASAYALPGFHHPGGTGPRTLHALEALRSGADRTLDFEHVWALVSFPSLHGATALLLAAATRGLGVWRYPFLAFNVLVLVSTLNEGGYNITDVIAGAAVACTALAAAGALYPALRRGALARRDPHARPALAAP